MDHSPHVFRQMNVMNRNSNTWLAGMGKQKGLESLSENREWRRRCDVERQVVPDCGTRNRKRPLADFRETNGRNFHTNERKFLLRNFQSTFNMLAAVPFGDQFFKKSTHCTVKTIKIYFRHSYQFTSSKTKCVSAATWLARHHVAWPKWEIRRRVEVSSLGR